ncbi:cadherin-like domain-containing protein [Cyanobacterium aponinum]|uniref:cadherin-like domain-containing protein n=1 Tax=Cyanobacterium aponinum TaxID=379064 RepID=UPI000C12A1DC|nr:cadherin-like domain-containing protein [Cyanobacterium aponinum]PHV61736.1 hypothetical protein CSQ80_14195 [Cyanobacterium aponinum IPPAS B-1201]
MAITIIDVNPTPFEYIFNEDNLFTFNTISLNDDPSATVTVTLTVSNGTLTLDTNAIPNLTFTTGDGTNDTAVEFSGALADVNDALSGLTFTPNTHFNGNETLSISISSSVPDGTNPPIVTADSQNVSLAITAVNDDPVLTPISALAVDEGEANVVFTDAQFGLSDPDIITGQQVVTQQIVSIESLPTKGTLRLNGNILVVGSVFSYDQLSQLTYTHNGDDVSPGDTDFFTVKVNDGGGGESAPTQINIDLIPVNIAPIIAFDEVAFLEGSINNLRFPVIDLGDNADTPETATITINAVDNAGQGTLYFDADNNGQYTTGEDLFVNQTFTADQVFKIKFDSNGAEPTLPLPSYTITVTDAGGGLGAGNELSSTATIPVFINPVDDDPTLGVNNSLTVEGGSTTVITDSFLRVDDIDSEAKNLVYSLDSRPIKGVLQLYIGGVTGDKNDNNNWVNLGIGGLFSQKQINDEDIRYVHEVHSTNLTDTDSFSFVVRDSALRTIFPIADEEGGIRSTPLPSIDPRPLDIITFNININNPQTDPLVTNPSGSTTGYGGDTGTRLDNAPIVDVATTFTKNNSPQVPNEGGFNVITDEMLNYKFVNSGVTVIPDEQVVYTLKSLPDNIDPGGGLFKNGVKLVVDSTFTQQDINDGLITFVHNDTENFISSFDYSVSYGGEVRINDTFSIDVNPVNDTPTIGQGSSVTLKEGEVTTITSSQLSLNDVDGVGSDKSTGFATINNLEFQVTALPTRGTLFLDVNNNGIIDVGEEITTTQWITKQDLIDGKVKYLHDGTENFIDQFTVRARDDQNRPEGQPDSSISGTADINIDVFPVNDTPIVPLTTGALDITIPDPLTVNGVTEIATATNKGLGFVTPLNEGDSGVITNNLLQAVDPDNNRIQRQYRITSGGNVQNGTLLLDGKVLGVGSTFTQKDIDDGKLSYKHNGSENFTDFFRFTISDGNKTTQVAQFNIQVNPLNDKATLATATTTFNLDSTSPLPITGISLADVDLVNVAVGETDRIRVTIDPKLTQAFNGQNSGDTFNAGTLNLVTTNNITFIQGTNNTLGNKLVIEGTLADINNALASLTYQTNTDLNQTIALNVTVDDRLYDGSGNVIGANGGLLNQGTNGVTLPLNDSNNTVTRIININVSTANDNTILNVPANVTVTEDVASGAIFSGIEVRDPDTFQTTNNTVQLTVTNGTLSFNNPPSGFTITGNGTDTITITGTFEPIAIDALFNALRYTGDVNFNGIDTLEIQALGQGSVGQGGSNIAIADIPINVTPVNDVPTLAVPGAQNITSNSPLVFNTTNGNVITIDDLADLNNNGVDNFTVTLTAGSGTLALSGSSTLTDTDGNAAIITITGTKNDINNALNGLSFTPDNYNNDAPININVLVNDLGNGSPTVGDNPLTATNNIRVNISDQNNAPSFVDLDATPTYTENGSAIVLDSNATVIDPELSGLFNNWNGASLTLERQSGANSEDIFGTTGNLTFSGSDVILNGTTIGTLATNSNGTLTITFNNSATTARVNSALQQITYNNSSEDPPTSVAIAYTINDGNPIINQGAGGALTGSGLINITITPQADAPVITPTTGNAIFTEAVGQIGNNIAISVDNAITLTDVDDTQMANATISISSGFRTGDILSINGATIGQVIAGTNITFDSYNSGTGVLTLSGTDTKANYETVLQSLTFINTGDDPTNTTRTITYNVTDANSDGAGAATGTATRNITVIPINDEPTLISNGLNPKFVEGNNFKTLFNNSVTSTIEAGQLINQLVFTVSNLSNGGNERLRINGTPFNLTNGTNFTLSSGLYSGNVSVSGGIATVTINSSSGATSAQINALVDSIAYRNFSQDPTAGNRVVTITSITDNGGVLDGGDNNSNPNLISTIEVIPVNDQPTLNATGVNNAPYNENASAVDLFSTISSSTIESGQTLTQLQLTVNNVSDGVNEVLNIDGSAVTLTNGNTVNTTNGYTINVSESSGTATLTITKTGNATTSQINSLVNGLSYQNNSEAPTAGNRTITITTLTDSGANNSFNVDGVTYDNDNFNENINRIATVVVNPINDAPVLNPTPDLSLSTIEDIGIPSGAVGFLIGNFVDLVDGNNNDNITDVDDNPFTGIALTNASNLGKIYYSTNNGTNWTEFTGTLSDSNALLLANDGNTRLFFSPNTDINGTLASGITFRAWDQTTGTNGFTANTTTNGGTTAFSSATDTIRINIAPVNDAPTRTSATTNLTSILEDNTNPVGATVDSLFNPTFSDVRDNQIVNGGSSPNDFAGIAITNNNANASTQGVWQYSSNGGTSWTPLPSVSSGSAFVLAPTDLLRFVPVANYHGTPGSLITRLIDTSSGAVTSGTTVNVSNDTSLSGVTTPYSNSGNAVTLNTGIISVNDEPSGADNTVTTNEDQSYTFNIADFGFTDLPNDAIAPNSLNRVLITTLPTNGTLTLNGSSITAGTFINIADISAGNLRFAPDTNENGNNYANFTFQVEDNGGTTNGGVNLDQTPNTITINVNPVNDAPTAQGTVSINQESEDDNNPSGTIINSLILDPANYSDNLDDIVTAVGTDNDTPLSAIAVIGSTDYVAGQGTWQYSNGSGGWINIPVSGLSDTTALIIPAGRDIRFVPNPNFFGTPGSLAVRLADGTNILTASNSSSDFKNLGTVGGTSAWSNGTVTITTNGITNINDRPTATNTSITGAVEDNPTPALDVTSANFGYSDATDNQTGIIGGGNASTSFGGIAIVGNTANSVTQGNWEYNTGSGWVNVGLVSDNSALILPENAQLRFNPNPNFNGTPDPLSIRVADTSQTFASGVNITGNLTQTSTWSETIDLSAPISPRNDNPVLTATHGNIFVTENNTTGTGNSIEPVNLLSNSNVTDIDLSTTNGLNSSIFGAGTITAQITDGVSGDILQINPSFTLPNGVTVSGGTGNIPFIITLDGDTTLTEVNDILNNIQYRSSSDNPTNFGTDNTRQYNIFVNDGNNIQGVNNAGGLNPLNSNTLSGGIAITPTNDPPVIDFDPTDLGTLNYTTTFTEMSVPDTGANAVNFTINNGSGTNVSDPDSTLLSNLTISIDSNTIQTGDQLRLGITVIDLTSATGSGTVTYGGTTFAYNVSDVSGQRTITFTNNSGVTVPLTDFETLVDDLKYNSSSDDPNGTRVFSATVTDDDNLISSIATFTVNLVGVNDSPIFTDLDNLTHIEGEPAEIYDNDVTLSDIDSPNFNGGFLRIFYPTPLNLGGVNNSSFDSGDQLGINTSGDITITGANNNIVNYQGQRIGVIVTGLNGQDGSELRIRFDRDQATPTAVEALIENVTFNNTSDDPSANDRRIRFLVIDGDGQNNGGSDRTALTRTITVVPVNDEPTLTATPLNPNYIEDNSPVQVFSGTVADAIESGQTLTDFQLTITNITDTNEILTIDGTPITLSNGSGTTTNGLNYTVSIDVSNTATLTFSGGNLSESSFQTLVNNIAYENTSDIPNDSNTRVVTITSLTDNGNNGTNYTDENGNIYTDDNINDTLAITSTITIIPTNDPPEGINSTINVNEDNDYVFQVTDFPFTDIEGDDLSAVIIESLPSNGILLYNGNLVDPANNINDVIPIADINNGNLIFRPTNPNDNRIGSSYTNFQFRVQDDGGTANGGNDTAINTNILTINLNPVNDAPTGKDVILSDPKYTGYGTPPYYTISNIFNTANGNFNDNTDQVTGGSSANDLLGIAVVGNNAPNSGQGQWQYLAGRSWRSIPSTISDNNALLLLPTTRIRFLPASGFTGIPEPLEVRLVDNNNGTGTAFGTFLNFSSVNLATRSTGLNGTNPTNTSAISDKVDIYTDGTVNTPPVINDLDGKSFTTNINSGVFVIDAQVNSSGSPKATLIDNELLKNTGTLIVQAQGNFYFGGDITGETIGFGAEVTVNGNILSISGTQIGTFTGGSNGNPLEITFAKELTQTEANILIQNITYNVNEHKGIRKLSFIANDSELNSNLAEVYIRVDDPWSPDNTMIGDESEQPRSDTIIGTPQNDLINGKGANDALYGREGDDVIISESGNSILDGDTGNDTLIGSMDNDIMRGGIDNDLLIGGGGDDQMVAGNGNDTLVGGDGADELIGDAGADYFVYASATDSLLNGYDYIKDFNSSEGDKIITENTLNNVMDIGLISNLNESSIQSTLSGLAENTAVVLELNGVSAQYFLVINQSGVGFDANSDTFIRINTNQLTMADFMTLNSSGLV